MSLSGKWLKTASNGKRLQFRNGAYTAIGAAGIDFGPINSTALLHGGGTETYRLTTSTANSKFLAYYCSSSAATGDTRTAYLDLELAGAGAAAGDAVRTRISVSGTGIGYATGLHSTCQIAAGGTVAGESSGLRATYEAASATRNLGGAISALHLASYVGANNTMPTINAFIRCTKDGSVNFDHLLALPAAAADSTIFATHTTQNFSHSIRIIDSAGTAYYIMCVDDATNRGGGS